MRVITDFSHGMKDIKLKVFSDISTRMGFEPTRAEPNGLAVHRLNHSATSSCPATSLPGGTYLFGFDINSHGVHVASTVL